MCSLCINRGNTLGAGTRTYNRRRILNILRLIANNTDKRSFTHPLRLSAFSLCSPLQVFALAAWQSKRVSHSGDGLDINDIPKNVNLIYEIGEPEFAPRTDSQDAWIFRSPLPSVVADTTDFEMGRPR